MINRPQIAVGIGSIIARVSVITVDDISSLKHGNYGGTYLPYVRRSAPNLRRLPNVRRNSGTREVRTREFVVHKTPLVSFAHVIFYTSTKVFLLLPPWIVYFSHLFFWGDAEWDRCETQEVLRNPDTCFSDVQWTYNLWLIHEPSV